MSRKEKYIGLNQRIPFDVLDSAICDYFRNGSIDRDFILQRMLEHTSGENRAKKATTYIYQILTRQGDFLNQLRRQLKGEAYSSLRIDDRKAFSLCLISLTYPITYDLLIALAQGFKVQNQINKKFISEKIKSLYGSNRTVDVAIDALLPIIIEHNTIMRDKISLYSLGSKLFVYNKYISELVVYTDIRLSNSKSILIEDMSYRPWYLYFALSGLNLNSHNFLLTLKDSSIGKGYLTLLQSTPYK